MAALLCVAMLINEVSDEEVPPPPHARCRLKGSSIEVYIQYRSEKVYIQMLYNLGLSSYTLDMRVVVRRYICPCRVDLRSCTPLSMFRHRFFHLRRRNRVLHIRIDECILNKYYIKKGCKNTYTYVAQ